MQFDFNKESAKEASFSGFPQAIQKSGAYIGYLKQVFYITASTGNAGIKFQFVGEDNTTGDSSLYKFGNDDKGKPTVSQKLVMSLMGLLKTARLTPKQNTPCRQWDFNLQADKDVYLTTYPDAENKRIGVFFAAEENIYPSKSTGFYERAKNPRLSIMCFFDPETQQIYAEKTDDKPAEHVQKLLASVPPLKPSADAWRVGQPINGGAQQQQSFSATPAPDGGFDDDIPF